MGRIAEKLLFVHGHMIGIGLVITLLAAMGCSPVVVTPLPPTVRRIAVLPPYHRGAVEMRTASADTALVRPFEMTVGDVLVQQARTRLPEKGLEIIAPSVVQLATKRRMPTSPQSAAQIMEEAHLDATALYIEVRRWESTPESRGIKADGVIVALDVMMIDPKTGMILWQVHRPSRPVPLRRRADRPSPCLRSRDGHAGGICTTRVKETQRLSANL